LNNKQETVCRQRLTDRTGMTQRNPKISGVVGRRLGPHKRRRMTTLFSSRSQARIGPSQNLDHYQRCRLVVTRCRKLNLHSGSPTVIAKKGVDKEIAPRVLKELTIIYSKEP